MRQSFTKQQPPDNLEPLGLAGSLLYFGIPTIVVGIVLFIVNAISVTSEEFWWRGVVLPRQEKGLGSWAWVVHGLLWAPFHLFKYWDFIPLFGITLAIAYLGQRTKNTTATFILHMIVNLASGVAGTFLIAAGIGV